MKRRRLTPSRLENKWTEGELDLGEWLARAEERCLRVGMLTERLEREREEVLKKIEDYRKREATQQIPVDSSKQGAGGMDPCSGTRKHAPTVVGDKHASTGNGGSYTLLGLIGWWRRMEKEEENFWKTADRRQQAAIAKVSFFTTKFVKNLQTTPRKNYLLEKNKSMKDSSIPALHISRDAEKRKEFYDHSQGSPSKRQNTQFMITREFWVGKSRSDEQQLLISTNYIAAQPLSV